MQKMKKMNNLLVIIAAAGTGKRFGSNVPKQYSKLDGRSVIERSVTPFIDSVNVSKIIIAISIVLWVLSSFAPGNKFEQIEQKWAGIENAEMQI